MRGLLQALVTGASLLVLLACGGGGGGTATPPAPPSAPVISSFTAARTPITAGTSTTLTAVFSNGSGSIDHGVGAVTSGQAVAASPTTTTTYLLTVTNSAGTSVTQTTTVAVVATPVAQIASTIPADAVLTAGAAGFQAEVPDQPGCTYAWTLSGGTLDAGAGTRSVRFSAGAAGTLSLAVTVTNAAGTAQQGTWSRPVLAPPPGVALSAPTEASVDTLDLSASVTPVAGASYQWAISGGTITAGADRSTVSFATGPAAAASGATVAAPACGTLILTLTLKLPDGRTFLFSIVILLACDPNAVPSVPATASAGQSGLVGSVHEQRNCTYTWAVNGGTLTAGQGTHRITFSAGSPGTMTVQCTVRNSSAVSKTGIATVTVLPTSTPTIQYTPAVYVLTRGVSAPAIAPTVSGGSITTWAIAPTLPAGLAFSTLTGAISGTPTALSPATTYSVSGAYPGGTATTTLSLAVQEAPTGISYPGSPFTFTRGQSIGAIAPVVNGGTPTAWSIVPTLPAGLAFSATTGIISGQTSTLSAATVYTVSATHSGGTFTTGLTLAVVDLAPGIRYTPSNSVFTKGTAIDLITPTNLGGAADSWTIAPALPTGLSFNTVTGQISGTPTVLSSATEYTVTARNSGGPGSTTLTLTVNDVRPAIAYGAPSYAFTKGEAITPLTPTNSGGTILTWAIAPALPAGLNFNAATGQITGTPTTLIPSTPYTITASNSGGIGTANISLSVNDLTPNFSYPSTTYTFVTGVSVGTIMPTSTGGSVLSWGISPALPQGLVFSTATGAISGIAAGTSAAASYTVLAMNGSGSLSTLLTLAVILPPALNITSQPSDRWVSVGQAGTFSVTAAGTGILSYQWHRNGVEIAGAVSSEYTTPLAALTDNGAQFSVKVNDTFGGSMVSSSATLTVKPETWAPSGSMQAARSAHTLTTLPDGSVFVVGGAPGSSYAERFDPQSGLFSNIAALNAPSRHGHTATLLSDGTILVAGGWVNGTGEVYNPSTGVFSSPSPMVQARRTHSATLLPTGKVLLAGGFSAGGGDPQASAELFDPSTGAFTVTGPMAAARYHQTATLLANGKVLIAGGSNGASLATAELYDPSTGLFSPTGSMTTYRESPSATLLADGRVLITGGANAGVIQTAELYDPSTGMFTATGSLLRSRAYHTATLLPSGLVLITGGAGAVNTCELYDPSSATFTATMPMQQGRFYHAAALLLDGSVLISGGTPDGIVNLANAERFDPRDPLPPAFHFTPSDVILNRGIGDFSIAPVSTGGIATSWTIMPTLPSGLAMNPASGEVTGTPATMTSRQLFRVTGSNANGSAEAGFILKVKDLPPSIGYSPNTFEFVTGVNVGTITPSSTGGTVVSWSVSPELPAGLAFNTTNGVITGTPTAATTSATYTVQATNSGGIMSVELSIRVNAVALVITVQPIDQLVSIGQTATFSVSAAGSGTLSYQWRKGGTIIPGQTSQSYTTPVLGLSNSGAAYSVVVSDSVGGNLTSTDATLTVVRGVFNSTANMLTVRELHTSTLLSNGLVLVAGGYQGGGSNTNLTDLFNPNTGQFTATGPLTISRYGHTATLLPNGKVLIAGGASTASAELYDPGTGQFSSAGPMVELRRYHTATMLPNGKVLFTGGWDVGNSPPSQSAELYDPTTGLFTGTGPMSTGRTDHTATLLPNGMVLVVAGRNSVGSLALCDLYDPASGTFTPTGSLSVPRNLHTSTALPNGLVLVAGGAKDTAGNLASAELYNPQTGMFSATGSMSVSRHYHTSILLPNGKVLIVGGWHSTITEQFVTASSELFDPATTTFESTGSTIQARSAHSATLMPNGFVMVTGGARTGIFLSSAELYDPQEPNPGVSNLLGTSICKSSLHTSVLMPNGKILIAGGYFGAVAKPHLTSLAVFDPINQSVNFPSTMTDGRSSHTATLLPNGKILIAGGEGETSQHNAIPLNKTEIFDSYNLTCTVNTQMTSSRSSHTATILSDGRVLFCGGESYTGPNVPLVSTVMTAELYNSNLGIFTQIAGTINFARMKHTSTKLPNGKVLITGGLVPNEGPSLSAELFDPVTNTFSITGSMITPRYRHSATLLPNGKVLITGGTTNLSSQTSKCELYDPSTGTFTPAGDMNLGRFWHSATLLPTGKVLIAGGWSTRIDIETGTEIYDPQTDTFSLSGSLNIGRYAHTAILLSTGKVLIISGGDFGWPTNTSEIYQ